ncbi:hypothetical protein CR513_58581, partial [Mucuna pruriens]
MKQLTTNNLEFQQSVSSNNMQFQQNMTTTIQDLKMQIGQLANTVSQLQSAGSSNLPSQTIPNPRGNASVVTLRSGKELPQPTLQQLPRSAEADSEQNADLQSRPEMTVPLPFPSRTTSARKSESDEELLKMFRKVEINIPLLDAIKQVPKYAKFLKELCVHKRRKIKGSKEVGGVVSALMKNETITTGAPTLPKKCRDPRIFSVPCTIGECTFADAMLDLGGASINVMPASIYRSLNFAMKHPTEDHSLFGIDLLDEIVEEYLQQNSSSEDIEKFAENTDESSCLGVSDEEADQEEVQDLPNSEDNYNDIVDLAFEEELSELLDQVCNHKHSESNADSNPTRNEAAKSSRPKQPKAEIMSAHLVPSQDQVGQLDPNSETKNSPLPPPPMELKTLPSHLKYAYLDKKQQLPVIIANNLRQEQHKKAIGWKLSDLPGINPSICMHRILMEEEIKPTRQQQRRLNPTLLDVVKREVTKLLAIGIIYPISVSQWVSPIQVVPKKSGMTVMKNQQNELVQTRIQNSW